MLVFFIHKLESRIRDIDESCFGHTEESYLIGRTESVLESSEDAIILVFAALQEEHGIDQVLKNLRSRDSSLFGDVSDKDDGAPCSLGEFHKNLGHVANLCDTPRLRRHIKRRYHTHRIYDDEPRIVPFERFQDILQRIGRKESDVFIGDTETIRPVGDLMDVFFCGNIDSSIIRITKPISNLQRQGRFPDSWLSGEEYETPGCQSVTEYRIEFIATQLYFDDGLFGWKYPENLLFFSTRLFFALGDGSLFFERAPFPTSTAFSLPFLARSSTFTTSKHD